MWGMALARLVDDIENNMQSFEYSDEIENNATMCGKQKEPESDCTELRALLLFLLLWKAMFKVADRAIVLKVFQAGLIWHWPNGEVVSAKCSHVSYPRHPHQAQKEAMWFPSNENYEVKSRKDILDAANALKNLQEHHLVINLISQDLIEKAGNGNLMKTTKQLQRKYTKLKH
ncbi:hypothetical protein pdam_00020173 [Pocillopora damicornis]|uniref:Uncharacterized protein n=1 Tax=Pocillopora damicornis TaxID=46731 RepID=A0A3M6U5N8_POCDA|nr:hypothetical protein pdam_00020173 [Pocillopora damicornis]